METYRCAGCGPRPLRAFGQLRRDRPRQIRSRCRRCRREDRYRGMWADPCHQCQLHRRLDSNQRCRRCNAAAGLRQCRACGELKALLLDFWSRKARCIKCSRSEPAAG